MEDRVWGLEDAGCQIGVQKRRRTDMTDLYNYLSQSTRLFLEVHRTLPYQSRSGYMLQGTTVFRRMRSDESQGGGWMEIEEDSKRLR